MLTHVCFGPGDTRLAPGACRHAHSSERTTSRATRLEKPDRGLGPLTLGCRRAGTARRYQSDGQLQPVSQRLLAFRPTIDPATKTRTRSPGLGANGYRPETSRVSHGDFLGNSPGQSRTSLRRGSTPEIRSHPSRPVCLATLRQQHRVVYRVTEPPPTLRPAIARKMHPADLLQPELSKTSTHAFGAYRVPPRG